MTSPTVPEVILLGKNTRYRHFARGPVDFYAPEAMLPDPPPQHVWRYCVSTEHGNTVYFHNDTSGRSLWVLPTLTMDGAEVSDGALEVMHVVGSVESAAAKNDTKRRSLSSASTAKSEAVKQTRGESDGEQKETGRTTQSATPVDVVNNSNNNNNSQGKVSVSERLAMWRARRAQQQEKKDGDSQHTSSIVTQSLPLRRSEELNHVRHDCSSLQDKSASMVATSSGVLNKTPALDLSTGVVTGKDKRVRILSIQGENTDPSLNNPQQCTLPDGAVYDDGRRLFLEANEELKREREAALQKKRDTLERACRLRELQQQEEEERTRLATERKELERRRLELERRAVERQSELLAKADEEAMRRELSAKLDDFFEKKSRLEQQAQAERRRASCLEEAIAESLLRSVSTNSRTLPVEERRIDLRLLEDEEESEEQEVEETSQNTKRSNTHQEQRRCKRLEYGPSFAYVGDVATGGRGKAPPFLRRQGHGTYFYDAAQKYFFEGEWEDDKRNGRGVISLPHVMVEGTWRDDKLEGRARLQTKRLKGAAELRQGVLEGNAVMELDCNGVFAGKLKNNGAIVESGAMTLSSGDHVEWLNDAEDINSRRALRPLPKSTNGFGRCRIRFANGDVYVGQVENYRPHGDGFYRFAEEGHEYVGEFQHGFFQGKGTYRFANGNVYVGQLYKGLFHGQGEYVQQDAYTYEGSWEYGTAHGSGKLSFVNGDVWEGEFDHDRRLSGRYTASRLFRLQ